MQISPAPTGDLVGKPSVEAHPDLAAVRIMLRNANLLPPTSGDVHAVRDYLNRMNGLTGADSVALAQEQILYLTVNGRNVPCKLYWPDKARRPPLMFYCHGGGFRHGELAGWDAPLRQIVRDSGTAVLSIGYALSPEYKFPTAFNEVVEVMRRIIADGAVDGLEVGSFAAGGDSAGANLVLASTIALREARISVFRHLMLLYGVYSKNLASPSWQRLSGYGGHGLSSASMRTYWESYLTQDEADWRVQPLYADLAGLPPARITVGDMDPLLDENIALAEKLKAAGCVVQLTVLPKIIHGVVRFNEVAPVIKEMLRVEADALRHALA
ncbi:alpha/beta hydrolase [Sphingobium sp. SCG-1]|uniref:alpha/beta hydrolase n=1 Tax=Sphingobium sp. SCG-1 TaxID=2072936 RepID=UPI000CD6B8C5|nr:alpha/beta hydrolase [Sphingobium sp. SCG-1]AUW56996.1 alpha/beta hydrolase [Sphingobium sp. SCG-1]